MSGLDINKLSRELEKAAEKMRNDNATYVVHEFLSPGHGEGNYRFEFHAKKKGGFGLLSSVANIARSAIYGGIEGAVYSTISEIGERKFRATFEPIDQEMKGHEVASLLKRWSKTVKEGFIETIGSDLLLPDDPDYISATIKSGKEIRLTIDFARLKSSEQRVKEEAPVPPPSVPQQVTPPTPSVPTPIAVPPNIAMMLPTLIPQIYLVGSLRDVEEGFQFMLHNSISPVNIIAPIEVIVDGEAISSENIMVIIGQASRASKSITPDNPLVFGHGEQMIIRVHGKTLSSGLHTIGIKTNVQELGPINFSIKDQVS
mgnify:CR=1 FL=1